MPDTLPGLTPEQAEVLRQFKAFMHSDVPCFILRGSAGTGKTTMVRHIAAYLQSQQRIFAVLAPTGRAARVLNHKTGVGASTIHSCIYDFDKVTSELDEEGEGADQGAGITFHFRLKANDGLTSVYLVDEASMVSDEWIKQEMLRFGSGKLLTDLVRFSNVNVGESNVKLVFIGDYCQLPPVGMKVSPALAADYLREHHRLSSIDAVLNKVVRQSNESAILARATALRSQIQDKTFNRMDVGPASGQIIPILPKNAVLLATEVARGGRWLPIISRSNRGASMYNMSVRGHLWGDEQASPQTGDYLIVIKNSSKHNLLNGDNVKIGSVAPATETRTVRMRGGEPVELKFRSVRLLYRQPDNSVQELDAFILENTLYSTERQPTTEEVRALYVDFRQRHPDLSPGTEAFGLSLRADPYFNALLVKFGYAMTCHKAQGGEWGAVIVDFSGFDGHNNSEFYRWVYTAITRAKQTLYTVDAPFFDEFTQIREQWEGLTHSDNEPLASWSASGEDPDFLRFSFPEGKQFLFDIFVRLRDAWGTAGITIDSVRHLPYQEQIIFRREADTATIQYHYKSSGKMNAAGPLLLPGGGMVGNEALSLARQALSVNNDTDLGRPQLLSDFENKVRCAVVGRDIELCTITSMPYRERYQFKHRGQSISLDFNYNGKQQWTGVTEVGGNTPAGAEVLRQLAGVLGT